MVIKVQYDINNVYVSTTESPVYINVRYDVASDPLKVPYVGATDDVDLGEFGIEAGYVQFDTTPTNTPTDQGTLYWDDSRETVAMIMDGTIQHIGQDTFFYVKNMSGSSIPKGTGVRFAGTDGASGHIKIVPFLANGTFPSTYFMGVTAETIGQGEFGQVMHFGELEGINTSTFSAGALLYASTTVAGGFQTSVPVAPNNIVLVAAAVNSKNNGAIVVRPTPGSNINNDEGVRIVSPTNGQVLKYNSTSGLWENGTDASSNIYNSDGTLTGNRVVTMGSNTLSFEKDIVVNAVNIGAGPRGAINANLAFGDGALENQVGGSNNIAIGRDALKTIDGSENVAVGTFAMDQATSALDNVAIGHNALTTLSTGDKNAVVGYAAGTSIQTGSRNSALGNAALSGTISGQYNIGIGNSGLSGNQTGSYNIGIGDVAGTRIADGVTSNTDPSNSIFIGSETKALADSQTNQIVIGHQAVGLGSNTIVLGNSSTSFGRWYGNLLLGTNTNSGYILDAVGSARFSADILVNGLTVGRGEGDFYENSAFGGEALVNNNTGINIAAFGTNALYSNTNGNSNTAIGYQSMYDNTSGSENTAIGVLSLNNNTSGNENAAIGGYALAENTTGYNNSALGMYAGRSAGALFANNQTSNNSVYLGYNTRAGVSGSTNEIVIGASALGNGSNTVTIGNNSVANTYLKGVLNVATINAATTDTDKFLVSDSGVIKFRTGAELLSDIGGQAALTNPVTGTGVSGQVSYWSGTGTQAGSNNLFWDNANGRLGIGTNAPDIKLKVQSSVANYDGIIYKNTSSTGVALISIAGSAASANDVSIFVGSPSQTTRALYGLTGNFADLSANTANGFAMGTASDVPFIIGVGGTARARFFQTTGNLLLQNGGTFTDSGQRLQVQGTALISGQLTLSNYASTTIPYFGTGGAISSTTNFAYDATNNILNLTATDSSFVYANIGRSGVAGAIQFGRAGDTNQFFTGTVRGDLVIKAFSSDSSKKLFIGATSGNDSSIVIFPSTRNVAIGTTVDSLAELTISGSITASSAIARGTLINTSLIAAANNDVLVGLDVNPTFTNGAFTGVSNLGIRIGTGINLSSSAGTNTGGTINQFTTANNRYATTSFFNSSNVLGASFGYGDSSVSETWLQDSFLLGPRTASGKLIVVRGTGATQSITMFSTGNLLIQNGGTHTDAGFRFDCNGTARVQGDTTITGVLRETVTTNRQTASYTLVLADRGKLVEMNVGSANDLTIPLNSSVAFPIGTKIDIAQYGAGQTTIVATSGVTVRSAGGALKMALQYSGASIVKIGTDEWYLFGDITV